MLVYVSGIYAFNKYLQRGQLHGILCGKYAVTSVRRSLPGSTPRGSRIVTCIVVKQPSTWDCRRTTPGCNSAFKESLRPREKSPSVKRGHVDLVLSMDNDEGQFSQKHCARQLFSCSRWVWGLHARETGVSCKNKNSEKYSKESQMTDSLDLT